MKFLKQVLIVKIVKMKNSKIVSIEPKGSFETKFGTMYSHHIKLENGDEGQVNSKTEEPNFKIGDDFDYSITESQYGFKIKREYPNFSGGGGGSFKSNPDRDARICRQNALTNAVNYFNANVNVTNEIATPKDIIELAEEFSNWTCNGEKKENPF